MSADRPRSPGPGRARPSLAWLTIRVTAILLAVLVLAHFAATHLLTDVADTDSAFIASRWQSGLIAATDWLMLVAAVLHGAAGAWTVIGDLVAAPAPRGRLRRLVLVGSAAMIALGTWTLLVVLGR